MQISALFVSLVSLLNIVSGHDFTNCQPSSNAVSVSKITLTPDQVVGGTTLKIELDATSNSAYSGVTADLVVKAFGVQLLSQSFPLSDLVSGSNVISVSQAVPTGVPVGLTVDATVQLVSKQVSKQVSTQVNLACVELEVKTATSGLRASTTGIDIVAYLYEKWITHHAKVHKDSELIAFRANAKLVMENRSLHREGKVTHKLGLNKFAGMSSEEFRKIMGLKTLPKREDKGGAFTENKLGGVSDTIDWVSKNLVLPVRDQKNAGTCWAFATTACAASAYAITNGKMFDLAPQLIVDCVNSKYGYQSEGINGGIPDESFDFLVKNGGELSKDYPYTQKDGTCEKSKHTVVAKFTKYVDVEGSNQDALLTALNQQPIAIAINAEPVQLYTSGILMESECDGNSLDHAVMVVSSGTDNGTKYWRIQNSWGNSWGEDGYFRLERTSGSGVGTCGLATQPSYIIAEKESNDVIAVM